MAEVVERLLEVDARARLFARLRAERAGSSDADAAWESASLADTPEA